MNHSDPDIDAMLRQAFDGPVADAGFTDGLTARLPARRRVTTWPLMLGMAVGVAVCWLSLDTTPVLRIAWRDWLSGQWSGSFLTVLVAAAGMSMLALIWTLSEAEDR